MLNICCKLCTFTSTPLLFAIFNFPLHGIPTPQIQHNMCNTAVYPSAASGRSKHISSYLCVDWMNLYCSIEYTCNMNPYNSRSLCATSLNFRDHHQPLRRLICTDFVRGMKTIHRKQNYSFYNVHVVIFKIELGNI